MMMVRCCSLASLLALPEAARSTTASMVLPSHHATFLFPTVVSRPRQLQRRGQSYLFGRTRPRLQASRSPSPLPVRRRSSSARGTAHPTVSRTSDARLDDGDGQVAGRHVSYEHSSSSSTSIGSGFGLVSAFAGVVPALCATGASAAAAAGEAGAGGMGARLDAPAAISFGGVFIAFAFLQARIRTAIRARTARREYEEVVRRIESQQLEGAADDEDVLRVKERMSQLVQEEQEARMVDVFGIPFNLVIPDGSGEGGGSGSSRGTVRQTLGRRSLGGGDWGGGKADGGEVGIREAVKEKADADLRDGKAREEEMTPAATLKVAALWLVLISQLWLLAVFWNDPMGPATSTFLRD